MLHEIHKWFTENLKDNVNQRSLAMTQDQARPSEPEFELCQESGTQSQIVCPHATINPGFSLHDPVIAQQALFACKCAMLSSDQSPHMTEVGAFACKSYPMAYIYG